MYLTFGHCKLFCYAPCPHLLFFGIGLYLGTIDQPSLFFLISTTALVLQLLMFCDLQPAALRCPAPLVFLLASVPKVGRGGGGGGVYKRRWPVNLQVYRSDAFIAGPKPSQQHFETIVGAPPWPLTFSVSSEHF